jgi:peptidoglycan/xylan/chitin deacetylase (PgdA/CDA1 family)
MEEEKLKQILKKGLYFAIYYSGILHLFIFALTKLKKNHCAVILFYHRFSSGALDGDLLPHLDIGEFEKQIRLIKRWYSVISMDELDKRLKSGEKFPLASVVITIDDGYLNNYKLAYPVLKKLNLPAIIYLTTGFIGTKNGLWVDDLADILLSTKLKTFCFPELFGDKVLDISTYQSKMETLTKLYEEMVRLEHNKKILIMRKLSNVLEENEVRRDDGERKMVNWDEVIEMSKNHISFGAHTVSHPTLSKMDLKVAKREIFESKMAIEARIGGKLIHFAIPNGKVEDFNEELKRYCGEIGISTVVSAEPGSVSTNSDPYFLVRILPPPPIHVFACKLAGYMFLKRVNKFDHPEYRNNLC